MLTRFATLFVPPSRRPALPDNDPPEAEAEADTACGWFDSSHDLKHGLEVVELDPALWPDTLPVAWPLCPMTSSAQLA